jgi:hypothetical protein
MTATWRRVKLGIVGATFSVCAAAILIRPLPSRQISPPSPQELYAVVLGEVNALREADYPAAYRQVSLSMQERYNLDLFADWVRTERPEVAHTERVEFGPMQTDGSTAQLRAYFFLRHGGALAMQYQFIREEGRWKIRSSRLIRRWTPDQRLSGTRT